ncbi:MAG: hypothetical protein F6K28_30030 [Microcoleus sp. SIO2G3]|nr:hypothetical protein [Microcoleus sp. SIO2G3]
MSKPRAIDAMLFKRISTKKCLSLEALSSIAAQPLFTSTFKMLSQRTEARSR